MDPLHTLKKFGIHDGHIEGDIEPANEKCNFPENGKLKTTCKLVSIFSCCIGRYDAAFQKKLICVVPCFLFPKLVVFWLKLKISLAKASDRFLTKSRKWVHGNIFEQVFINDSNLFILILRLYFGSRGIQHFYSETLKILKIGVCDLNIHRNFWGSKGVVERKLKSFFNFSFIAKNWGKKREKNSIFLLVFNPQMRSSLYWNKTQYFHSRANLCRDCAGKALCWYQALSREVCFACFTSLQNSITKKIWKNEEISGKKGFKGINQIDRKKKKEMKVKFGWLLKKTF